MHLLCECTCCVTCCVTWVDEFSSLRVLRVPLHVRVPELIELGSNRRATQHPIVVIALPKLVASTQHSLCHSAPAALPQYLSLSLGLSLGLAL